MRMEPAQLVNGLVNQLLVMVSYKNVADGFVYYNHMISGMN